MKIGILTLLPRINYGGILQAYALQTVLEQMGHEVYVFDKKKYWHLPLWRAPLHYLKRIFKKYVLKCTNIAIFAERRLNKEYVVVSSLVQPFIDQNLNCTIEANMEMLNEKDFDAIIVGSDQIWRPKYCHLNIEEAYLSFTKNCSIRRISYAASFGTDKWEYTKLQTKRCKELIEKFDSVSVREDSGVALCKKYFSIDASHVLDPTMLLKKEHYIRLFKKTNESQSQGKLFVYILDMNEDKQEVVTQLVEKEGYYPIVFNNSLILDFSLEVEKRISPSVESWLIGIYDAEFVVTDSFHACVFSILFNKPFIVYGNEGRGISRINSLLKQFNLESRLIFSSKDNGCKILKCCIDWGNVNGILNRLRDESLAFLENSLESKKRLS